MPNYTKRGRPPHNDQLTPAEWRVVHAAQHGLSNSQIAKQLEISINTVKFHISNAVDKIGVENKRALLNWLGIPKDSIANNSDVHTNVDNNSMNDHLLVVGQIARGVKNIGKSEHWYREVLGLKHLYTFGTMAFFDCNGVRLMLSQNENGVKDESIIYFKTQDIKVDYLNLQERGVEFSHAPHKIHQHHDGAEEWMAFFTDLEGRPLGLMCAYQAD